MGIIGYLTAKYLVDWAVQTHRTGSHKRYNPFNESFNPNNGAFLFDFAWSFVMGGAIGVTGNIKQIGFQQTFSNYAVMNTLHTILTNSGALMYDLAPQQVKSKYAFLSEVTEQYLEGGVDFFIGAFTALVTAGIEGVISFIQSIRLKPLKSGVATFIFAVISNITSVALSSALDNSVNPDCLEDPRRGFSCIHY